MLRFAVVLMLVSLVRGGDFGCCSQEDRHEVQAMWGGIWSAEHTGTRIIVAQAVFEDLFEREPDAKGIFARVNADDPDSPEFKAHCLRVLNGLDTAIGLFDDVGTLELQLDHLARQHHTKQDLGIKAEHFDVMGRSLLKVLPQVAGCFNIDAFTRCYSGISTKLGSYLAN